MTSSFDSEQWGQWIVDVVLWVVEISSGFAFFYNMTFKKFHITFIEPNSFDSHTSLFGDMTDPHKR